MAEQPAADTFYDCHRRVYVGWLRENGGISSSPLAAHEYLKFRMRNDMKRITDPLRVRQMAQALHRYTTGL